MAKKRGVVGECKLCHNRHPLRRSHIIPEFCYVGYDNRHRLIELDRKRTQPRYIQKGFREPLLCHGCEQLLNDRYEKPAKAAWFDNPKLPLRVSTSSVSVSGLDYTSFKLFHLSILWRAAVAAEGEYGPVQLPAHDEARLREMLRNVDPGQVEEYPIIALVLLLPPHREPAFDLIQTTSYEIVGNQRVYRTVYGACAWQIWTGGGLPRPELASCAVSTSGSFTLPAVDAREFAPIGRLWQEYQSRSQQL